MNTEPAFTPPPPPPFAFRGNTPVDDIAMLANLLYQVRDNAEAADLDCVTAYDENTRTDYGIGEVLCYLRAKYGENI